MLNEHSSNNTGDISSLVIDYGSVCGFSYESRQYKGVQNSQLAEETSCKKLYFAAELR